tara:strand:- start:1432 stop:2475 length:1044 start_codon:yes stop_codon:yes gene_type:complete
MIDIRPNPDEVDAAWLTEVVAKRGFTGEVTDFKAESIGTGQVGQNVRFSLVGENIPSSIVGKFPSIDPVSRQTGIEQNNYNREVLFYQSIQPTVKVQTPIIFHTDIDLASHEFVLMMEDLAPGKQGNQLTGCSADDAAMALEQLAHLQGPRWADEDLSREPLLGGGTDRQDTTALHDFYAMLTPGYLERYQSRLSAEELDATGRLLPYLQTYQKIYEGQPLALVHGDYRLDNMMFGGPYPLTVVDWQSYFMGCPIQDVSYFMGTSLTTDVRRREERALIKHYLDVLNHYGADLSFDDCFRYYVNFAPAGMIMALIASMIVGETERGNDMFMVMAKGSIALCLDHERL